MKDKFFLSPKRLKQIKKIQNRCKVISVDQIENVQNGYIKSFDKKIPSLGVFDNNLNDIKSAEIRWDNFLLFKQKWGNVDGSKVAYVDKEVIYLGQTPGHFGHFLINTLDRAWPLTIDEFKDKAVVIIKTYYNNESYYSLLEYLGVRKENIIILDKTTQFKSVLVPQRSFKHKEIISQQFVDTFKKIASNITKSYPYNKIYVSRTNFVNKNNSGNMLFGEKQIENIFKQKGYHVIYPESLTIAEQIGYMKNCRHLAGVAGTALHLALFMQDGGEVVQINRSKCSFAYAQMQINNIKQHHSVYIDASIEKYKTNHSALVPQIIGCNKYVQDFLKSSKFVFSQSDIAEQPNVYSDYLQACKNTLRLKFVRSRFLHQLIAVMVRIICVFIPSRQLRHAIRAKI